MYIILRKKNRNQGQDNQSRQSSDHEMEAILPRPFSDHNDRIQQMLNDSQSLPYNLKGVRGGAQSFVPQAVSPFIKQQNLTVFENVYQ